MSNLLKDIYSSDFYIRFSDIIKDIIPSFDSRKFINLIFDNAWNSRELKDRMKHTANVLHNFLPKDFEKATKIIEKIISKLQLNRFTGVSIEFMFLPQYIETYGIEHFEASVKSIEFITRFTSCEYAVRPFIVRYGDKMIKQMYQWSLHENHKVRRLASEGTRSRLPWSIALPELKNDPSPVLPILENLKNDPSEWVRRSVANHLNDIAKDNPQIVTSIAKKWKNISKHTDAIIKHGCRSLLKQGHPEILEYYGLNNSKKIRVSAFNMTIPKVKIGNDLKFSFTIQNADKKPQTIRIEYAIFYLRQNGALSKKVFKISEKQFQPGERADIQRKQSFKIITTRKFYPGQQKFSLIINGQERKLAAFELTS